MGVAHVDGPEEAGGEEAALPDGGLGNQDGVCGLVVLVADLKAEGGEELYGGGAGIGDDLSVSAGARRRGVGTKEDEGIAAGIEEEAAEAGLDGGYVVDAGEGETVAAEGREVEGEAAVGEIEEIVEAGEKLLAEHALDVGGELVDAFEVAEEELLLVGRGGGEADFREVCAGHVGEAAGRDDFHLEGWVEAELAGDGGVELVGFCGGIEEEAEGALRAEEDPVDHGTAADQQEAGGLVGWCGGSCIARAGGGAYH